MMKRSNNRDFTRGLIVPLAAIVLSIAAGTGCGALDDFNSYLACQHYCSKNYECLGVMPTGEATDNCIANCRESIEFNCGDENQQAANDHIEECVDLGCPGFWTCMVFDSAPECYGFVAN